jgi:hypothetical protein
MQKLIRCLILVLLVVAFGQTVGISRTPPAPQARAEGKTDEPPATAGAQSTEPQAFKAGGTLIVLPAPTRDIVEIGDDKRPLLDVIVPADNRLVAAFVLVEDLPHIKQGDAGLTMSRYALVEVARRAEFTDCEASDFKEVVDTVKTQFGDLMNSTKGQVEDEFNNRMKALHLDEATMSLGQPIQLGCILSKPDAYGFGTIVPISKGGTTTNMGAGITLMRVKKRMLFVYLYAEYKNENTVKWLRDTTGEWTDAILEANK